MVNISTGECVLKLSDYIDAVTALDVRRPTHLFLI